MLDFLDDEYNFDLNNSIVDAINIHNNNMHTSTGYKPIDLFIIIMRKYLMKYLKI